MLRASFYEAVRQAPGLSLAELSRRLDAHPTTIRYHARLLVRAGLVSERVAARQRRFFLNGTRGAAAIAASRRALARATAREAYKAIARAPGIRASQIARVVGTSHENACYHAKRLAELSLVEAREEAGVRRYYPPAGALEGSRRRIASNTDDAFAGSEVAWE